MQNVGRWDALRAAWNSCSDIAGGNATGQRFSNELACGIASRFRDAPLPLMAMTLPPFGSQ